jgi:hypothetical protein
MRGQRRCPADFVVTPSLLEWAAKTVPHVNLSYETEAFKDYQYKTAHTDWSAAWRTWMRRAAQQRCYQPNKYETSYSRQQRERVAALTGGLVSTKHSEGDLFDAANLLGR